ncbi:MAG: HAD-IIA family hydrolase [Magnetococcales bacterium]|nr:HAD-IIA family hydrolase [Magnetococcales bacterium]
MGTKPHISSQEALTPRYGRYRQMLCRAQPDLETRLRQGRLVRTTLTGLVAGFDLILLDAFGVLNLGDGVIAGAPEAVAWMRQQGKAVRVVSNNASQSPANMIRKFKSWGFELEVGQILSSGMAVGPYVADSRYREVPYLLIGSEDSASAYAPDPERWMVNHPGSGRRLEEAEYILFCSNRDYHGGQQELDAVALLTQKKVPLLLANPDLATPKPDGRLEAVAGYAAMDLAERFELELEGIGKPFGPIFQEVVQRFPGVPRERILMIGDTLDTDILGAAAMGFASCLTLSGACAGWGERLESLCAARGICPDYVIDSLKNQ